MKTLLNMKYANKKLYSNDNKKLSGVAVDSINKKTTLADHYYDYTNRKQKSFFQKFLEYFLGNGYLDEENLVDRAVKPLKVISVCAPVDYVYKLDIKYFETTLDKTKLENYEDSLKASPGAELMEKFTRELVIPQDNIHKVLHKQVNAEDWVVTKEYSYSIAQMVKLAETELSKN